MPKKLHVLFLCGWYPSLILPTNGDFIQRHAEAVSLKHKVSVLHIITDKSGTKKIKYSKEIVNTVATHIAYLPYTKNPFLKVYLFFAAFNHLIKKIDVFDIVHLNEIYPFGIFSLYLKWFQKKPFIISEHFTGYHKPASNNLGYLRKVISKIITKNAAFVCPVSDNLKAALLDLGFKGTYKKVPNVVDTNLFKPNKNTNKRFTIVHVSNMINAHKNVKGILKVVRKLQDQTSNFLFKCIGENANKYADFAEELGISNTNIEFTDQIKHAEVAAEIAKSNLFVLFSNYENLPCVILEAFSCGVPVISSTVGGIHEYFPNDFGTLIAPKDEAALLKAIMTKKQQNVANKTKMHNYVTANFSKEKIATDFEKLYYKALKEQI